MYKESPGGCKPTPVSSGPPLLTPASEDTLCIPHVSQILPFFSPCLQTQVRPVRVNVKGTFVGKEERRRKSGRGSVGLEGWSRGCSEPRSAGDDKL